MDAYEEGFRDAENMVASWMLKHEFATGHGDSLDDLLHELAWQVAEIRAARSKPLAFEAEKNRIKGEQTK